MWPNRRVENFALDFEKNPVVGHAVAVVIATVTLFAKPRGDRPVVVVAV